MPSAKWLGLYWLFGSSLSKRLKGAWLFVSISAAPRLLIKMAFWLLAASGLALSPPLCALVAWRFSSLHERFSLLRRR